MIFSSVIPISGIVFRDESSQSLLNENIQYVQTVEIFDDLKVKLDRVTTKEEALAAVKNFIYELNNQGVLPKEISGGIAQRLITQAFLQSQLFTSFQFSNNNTGNSNCLIIGITNQTSFFPFPTIVDFPLLIQMINNFYTKHHIAAFFLTLPFLVRGLQPLKFGAKALIGRGLKETKNGNITIDSILPAYGWVWTYGTNGMQKWNGTFYGGLYTISGNGSFDNTSWGNWACVGIQGFVGINYFNFISNLGNNKLASIYIGFARKVNMTYNAPWWA